MTDRTNPGLMSNPLLPNGRKRRLTPLHKKHRDPTLIPYQPVKRQRANSNAPPNMAHLPGSNNHKMSAGTGGSAGRVGFNNLAKKSNQGKKLVIKNRKVKPDLPENYEAETWSKLAEVIVAVQLQRSISYSLEELYQAVENMCSHKMAANLYSNLRRECDHHVQSLVPKFNQPEMGDSELLLMVSKQWNDHCNQMIMIRSIFLYLDRTYAVPSTSVLSIWDMGLDLFGCHIISPARVQNRVVKGILSLITKERHGETVDRVLLKNLLTMLVDLRMYSEAFETDFLLETETVYRTESLRMMRDTEFTLPEYLSHVDRRLQQEMELLNNYLHKSTRKPLILCVEKQLIGEHLQEILDKGYESLLEAVRVSELSLLYGFFARFKDGLPLMSKAFSDYIKKSGVAIVSDAEREKTMVHELLELKSKVDGIIEKAFKNSQLFQGVVREGFEAVVNRRQNKPAELIAKYVDVQLRSGNKEWTDEQMERLMDKVMVLFRFINGKDVFEAFYKKDLAKRLLLGKSASFDAEKSMLLKLKQGVWSKLHQ
ncbi:Cullin-4A [Geodia barretti]|uniref:Cullin-4A n=1 Tax=Geodia barretti TaxID=519541 RepID=A0AA35W588_GEOBA|nr:Cullin-4A [Geodia barretti]